MLKDIKKTCKRCAHNPVHNTKSTVHISEVCKFGRCQKLSIFRILFLRIIRVFKNHGFCKHSLSSSDVTHVTSSQIISSDIQLTNLCLGMHLSIKLPLGNTQFTTGAIQNRLKSIAIPQSWPQWGSKSSNYFLRLP